MPPRLTNTPHYNRWLARLRHHLDAHGRKTALARHMAEERHQPLTTWRVRVSRIANGGQLINAEDLLAITAWMESWTDA
jgi:hypothetical protein